MFDFHPYMTIIFLWLLSRTRTKYLQEVISHVHFPTTTSALCFGIKLFDLNDFSIFKHYEVGPMNSLSLYFFAFTMYLLVHNSISKMRSSECSGSNSVLIIIISNIVRKKIFKDVQDSENSLYQGPLSLAWLANIEKVSQGFRQL